MPATLYAILLPTQVILACLVLPVLIFVAAPYGRHYHRGWGPVLHSRTAWLIMEVPAVLVIAVVYVAANGRAPGSLDWVYLLLWEIHYVYRTFIYPLLLRGSRRTFPLVVALMAMGFNVMNGYVNGYALFVERPAVTAVCELLCSRAAVGLALFAAGLSVNIWSDAIIRDLRRDLQEEGNGQRYGVPRGGLFRWVSNPHYLGEIVEWIGWALFAGTWAGWAFAIFTVANLLPRAVANHRWYHDTFPEYPDDRRILVPYVF
jgi:protein-S-isoprenylcysteine O-methyltransferase Ste14